MDTAVFVATIGNTRFIVQLPFSLIPDTTCNHVENLPIFSIT